MKKRQFLSVLVAPCALALAGSAVSAQIAVDGSLDTGYGTPLATQTITTDFGDSTVGDGTSKGGSELDAAYGTVQNGTLYLMFTGNFEGMGNHLDVFIDDGRSGQNVLAPFGSGALPNMKNSVFSPGFNATYALDANDYSGTLYLDTYDLSIGTGGYAGGVPLTGGIGNNQSLAGLAIGINNTNAAGVTASDDGTAVTDPSIPNAVTTGIEFGIPLSALGNPTQAIKVMAAVNGNNDGYLSNQFLPGLPAGTVNLGLGTTPYGLVSNPATPGAFDFSQYATPEYFSVNVNVPNGIWLSGSGGNWSDSSNWSNGAVPTNSGDIASFSNAAGGNVNIDGNFSVGTLSFNSPVSYYLEPDGNNDPLTLSNTNGANASIQDFGGTHEIDAPLVLASNTDINISNHGDVLLMVGNISGTGSLSFANPGGTSYVWLLGSNTYTGGTIINSGTVVLGTSTAFPDNSALTMNASDVPDPTLDLSGNSITVSSLNVITGPQTPIVNAQGQIINNGYSAVTVTYAGDNTGNFYGSIFDNTAGGYGPISLHVQTGSLSVSGPSNYQGTTTIDSGATLTLASNGVVTTTLGPGQIINNGALVGAGVSAVSKITGPGSLTAASGVLQLLPGSGQSQVGSIAFTGGAVDITNNSLLVNFGSAADPLSDIRAALQSGLDHGLWDGPGIISSTALATPGTGVGYADGNTDTGTPAGAGTVLIQYTWLGDLNLDGVVNASDFQTLSSNMGMTANADWADGDLNYDGKVNADDSALMMLGVSISGGSAISVPEPAALGLLLALPAVLSTRRRRRT